MSNGMTYKGKTENEEKEWIFHKFYNHASYLFKDWTLKSFSILIEWKYFMKGKSWNEICHGFLTQIHHTPILEIHLIFKIVSLFWRFQPMSLKFDKNDL